MESNIFFIDTSALVKIFGSYTTDLIDQVWEKLEELFVNDRMYSHQIVYDEITTDSKRPDLLSKRIGPMQKYFRPMSFEQAQLVSDIIKKYPDLIDEKSEKEQAGPWLIASAVLEQNQLSLFNRDKKIYIISEEDELNPNKIQSVSVNFGLYHLNLMKFYDLNNWPFRSVV